MTVDLQQMQTYSEDDMRQYLSEIRQYPRLTAEEERELAQRCAADRRRSHGRIRSH